MWASSAETAGASWEQHAVCRSTDRASRRGTWPRNLGGKPSPRCGPSRGYDGRSGPRSDAAPRACEGRAEHLPLGRGDRVADQDDRTAFSPPKSRFSVGDSVHPGTELTSKPRRQRGNRWSPGGTPARGAGPGSGPPLLSGRGSPSRGSADCNRKPVSPWRRAGPHPPRNTAGTGPKGASRAPCGHAGERK